jgi:hypothetical protein
MKKNSFAKLMTGAVTGAVLVLSSLMTSFDSASARPATGERGFWCDSATGTPLTLYQNASGNVETWIIWRSPVFNNLGYTPQSRCQDVSQNLETQRQTGKLGFLTSSTLNGMTVICAAQSEGVCDGILFTVNDSRRVADILGQLLALREGTPNTPPLEL